MPSQSFFKMNDGFEIPAVGLGTWKSEPGEVTYQAVLDSLKLGYRHIDTARAYGNEEDVGRAVRDSEVNREDIFVTTKLRYQDEGFESAIEACNKSLKRLDIGYIDLYLIHWPLKDKRVDAWKALEVLKEEGKCRSIGVSNFTIRHLEELKESCNVIPAINQVELHPYHFQQELLSYCNSENILIEAYSPLAHGKKLEEPRLVKIANRLNVTPAQILIRWAIQHGMIPLPKSINKGRIGENFDVFSFEIPSSVMSELDSLDEAYITCWNPSNPPSYAPT